VVLLEDKEIVKEFSNFLEKTYKKKLTEAITKGLRSLIIDFKELELESPELSEELLNSPEKTIDLFKEVIKEYYIDANEEEIIPRFTNLPEDRTVEIRNIRAKHINKFIVVDGLVRQASDVRPVSKEITFECPSCSQKILVPQNEFKLTLPKVCPNCGRRGGFKEVGKKLIDTQRIVIEEIPEMLEGGAQPKRISVFLQGDLVDPEIVKKTAPGSKIKVIGIVKEILVYSKTGSATTRYDLIIKANNTESIDKDFEEIVISPEDEKEIKKLAGDPDIYDKLTHSIAPSILGHEKIKLALALQLFGGVRKVRRDNTSVRGNIHIILVGDPGVAKSQILKYISNSAPKTRYVSGKGATGAGLTATVVKDEFLKGWSLEAGALVLANGGICCIDEMDKMNPDDRVAMHEVMEQETVSISKANIQATLNAQTTILAAANPKLGRFDPYEPLGKQIDMPPTLLNRFDLIFVLRDLPNRERDTQIARYVLEAASDPTSKTPEIESEFLRKYIAYAKMHSKPKLGPDAMEEIMNFYVNLRNKNTTKESEVRAIPISARQLEALIRLSEASARIRLKNTANRADALRAIDLLKWCLKKISSDEETGELDIDKILTGITTRQRTKIRAVKKLVENIIDDLEKKFPDAIPVIEILQEIEKKESDKEKAEELRKKAEEILERMKRDGEIFTPKKDMIKKVGW